MREYNCTYQELPTICEELCIKNELHFPEAYEKAEEMVKLARTIKELTGDSVCRLPFCHTLEAESLGAVVQSGTREISPRIKEPLAFCKLEELPLDDLSEQEVRARFRTGRIGETLKACRLLADHGETVVMEVEGPLSILAMLLPMTEVFKAIRKNPALLDRVLKGLEKYLLLYLEEIQKSGAAVVTYADPTSSLSIVGPKVASFMTENFTVHFVKEALKRMEQTRLVLCPKTSYALADMGFVSMNRKKLPEKMTFLTAVRNRLLPDEFAGFTCSKCMAKSDEIVYMKLTT